MFKIKNIKINKFLVFIIIILLVIVGYLTFFKKSKMDVINSLFKQYKNGSISECVSSDGKIYYSAGVNAYDGGGTVYNENGFSVGYTQGFTGKYYGPKLENCNDIYVVPNNIWGIEAVNIYNLK